MKRVFTSLIVAVSMVFVLFGNIGMVHAEDETITLNKGETQRLTFQGGSSAETFRWTSEDNSIVSCGGANFEFGSDYSLNWYCEIKGISEGKTHIYLKNRSGETIKTYNVECTGYDDIICPNSYTTIQVSSRFDQDYDFTENGKQIYAQQTGSSSIIIGSDARYSKTYQVYFSEEGVHNLHITGTIAGRLDYVIKVGHQWNLDYTIDRQPTCTSEGSKSIHCKRCGAVKEGSMVKLDKLPHEWNKDYTIDKAATCENAGEKSIHCKNCNTIKDGSKEAISALGHNYGDWIKLDDKQHQRICKNDSNHVEKEDHHFDKGKITTEPTYTKEGVKTYTCKDCGYTKEEKLSVKPHTHDYKEEVTKQPTCTEKGIKTYTCSICGDSYTKDIPALGHNYGDWTKLDDKQHQRICKNDSNHVEKVDHKWDQGKVTKAATDESEGVKIYTCSICHATKEEKIAKLAAQKKDEQQPQTIAQSQNAKSSLKASTKAQSSTKLSIDKKVATLKGDRDIGGSQFGLLQVKANKVTKSSIKVQWKKIKGAKGYIIYGNKCGKKYKRLTAVKGLSWTQRKLKKGTYYKYMVVAYNAKGQAISYSKTIHVTTLGGKKVNPKGVKVTTPKKLEMKINKKAQIKASYIITKNAKMSKHRGLAYESSNTKVAKVSQKGQIVAKKKGIATIYIYGQNGVMNKVQVKVK